MVTSTAIIAIACVAAAALLIIFRKKISKAYNDSLAGGDISRYDGKDMDKVLAESEARIREVLK